MQFVPTPDGTVPAPQPIRAVERWRVAWHGRRDAKHPPADPDQPQPFLESLRAEADIGQRAVNEWLHSKIDPIDRETVQVLILLDQHRRDPMLEPPDSPTKPAVDDDADQQPLFNIPPRVLRARETAAARNAYRQWVRETEQAEQRLGQLGSARHHVIEVARAAARAHVARYEQLVGLYSTALLRRDPDRQRAQPAMSPEPWLHVPMAAQGRRHAAHCRHDHQRQIDDMGVIAGVTT
jgi:hypothetical protein